LPIELVQQALDPDPAIAGPATRALFRDVIEPLSDSFELGDVDRYVRLFAPVIARLAPELDSSELIARYERVRRRGPYTGDASRVSNVFVLSRVTLGADVAVTSRVLDAAKRRFPASRIFLLGPRKCWELFAADGRIEHVDAGYPRGGTLVERLALRRELGATLGRPGSIVIDPDSRLTQLGLVPVCPEENYFFFESRSWGGAGAESLSALTRRWLEETFGVADARGYVAPEPCAEAPAITVSLGVGENPRKLVADPFEGELLRHLVRLERPILIDRGAGGEEAERVERAINRAGAPPGRIATWDGAFAPFAARVARSRLYVGYDSAGQHVAAACGVPLVTVFAGFTSERMYHRWRPEGPGPIEVVRVDGPDPAAVLEKTIAAITELA